MSSQITEADRTPYVFLGRSGLLVSNICLGTMTFGQSKLLQSKQTNEELSHQILNRYAEWGGNFIDTADAYGPGFSEEIIGYWLQGQPRERWVIATKCRYDVGLTVNINNQGLSRRHIIESIEGSLRRLNTDFVDLFQTHLFDEGTPLEETLRTFDDLVRAGKIRYIGVNNLSGWQLQKMVSTCEHLGLNSIVSLQQQYSLVSRESELEAFRVCKAAGIGVLAWSPLKGGLLTGKVTRGIQPTEGRMGWASVGSPVETEIAPHWTDLDSKTFDVIETVESIAKKHGLSGGGKKAPVTGLQKHASKISGRRDQGPLLVHPQGRSMSQVAIRWLLQKDVVSSVIIGATSLAQLDDNMSAAQGWCLTRDEMTQLDEVSSSPLQYPYNMLARYNVLRVNPFADDIRVKSLAESS